MENPKPDISFDGHLRLLNMYYMQLLFITKKLWVLGWVRDAFIRQFPGNIICADSVSMLCWLIYILFK